MKRCATLALAAIFALSFSANVAAAPVFTGELSVEVESIIEEGDGVDFVGGPEVSFTLKGSEEGLWEFSAELGTVGAETKVVGPGEDGEAGTPDDEVVSLGHDVAIGKYYLNVTPGPFSLAVWGNDYELSDVADAFEFIKSKKKADDGPKFRLTTDIAGVGITADYDTTGSDAFYAFAKAGMVGVALRDSDVANSEEGLGASADVTADLGVATVTGGVAFDFQQPDDVGSFAFGVKAESEVAPGLTVNAGYTSDGRGKPSDYPSTEISAGAEYVIDAITVGADISFETEDAAGKTVKDADTLNTMTIGGSLAYGEIAELSVEYMTTNEVSDEDPTITIEASAEYPVIADRLTISGEFLMVNDKQPGFASGDDYEWVDVDETEIGDDVSSVLEIGASAAYKVTSAFTVTPGFEYKAYTFQSENDKASATILKVDTTYAVSDAAELNFGIKNIATELEGNPPVGEADRTELSAGVTIKF